jgi:hypothetical protein
MNSIQPFQSGLIDIFFKTGNETGMNRSRIALYRGNKKILESAPWNYEVVPLPQLGFKVSLYPRLKQQGDDFEVQIFDNKEQLVYKVSRVSVEQGVGSVGQIKNIALDRKYRVVILKPYYLPRQTFVTFQRGANKVVFERMIPIDFNKDGTFNFSDIWTFITHPSLISLLLP